MKEPVGRFNSGFSGGFDFMDGLSFLDSKDIGYSLPSDAMPTFGRQRPQPKQDYQEQQRIRRVTEQRNQARREINSKTTEIVQMALAAVESSNGSNRQFISTAESAIRSILGAQAGGGTFANVGGTTGTVLRTAVAVLNSFNNPLRGIFS